MPNIPEVTIDGVTYKLKDSNLRQAFNATIDDNNLFVVSTTTDGKRLNTSGVPQTAADYYISDFIPVDAGAMYQKNSPVQDGYHRLCVYNSSKTFIPDSATNSNIVTIPNGGAFIQFCGLLTEKSGAYFGIITAKDKTARAEIADIQTELNAKVDYPEKTDDVSFATIRGIIKTNLTVYDQGDGYTGQYTQLSVTPGDVYFISGFSANNNYPCAFVALSGGTIMRLLSGSSVQYINEKITIPANAVTLYVNGNTNNQSIAIRKTDGVISQEEFYAEFAKPMKAYYENNVLFLKWKHDDTRDFCLTFGNVGNNGLFNFRRAYFIANNEPTPSDTFTQASDATYWLMSGSDWFGPYIVAAANNADGDNPETEMFTGGNHLTNDNTGGKTAYQISLAITIDGDRAVQTGKVYSCESVDIKWTNAVQAYNTSKANGSGRAVLNETWNVTIKSGEIRCKNTIHALEEIILKRYYGLQATCGGKKYRYIGGTNRNEYTFGTDANNSGANTCSSVSVYNDDFNMLLSVNPVDLGLFDKNEGYSFFTSSLSKLYAVFVRGTGNEITILSGENYYIDGCYMFN